MDISATKKSGENRVKLPVIGSPKLDFDLDAELKKFEDEQREVLGLKAAPEQWRDDNPQRFTKGQRHHTTVLVGGLTMAHDYLITGALGGLGYKVESLDCPDNAALQFGKEFGNRGQCNPTYFTVGNLVKHLTHLRDKQGLLVKDIVENHIFITAGACGPCRFGTYVTEYRKALRDAGFDGFRVMLFQQQGGLKQATGEAAGLEFNPKFFLALICAVMGGDVINVLGYRIRPYEKVPGATNKALEQAKKLVHDALHERTNILVAMVKARRVMRTVEVDRTIIKPKVSVIGEFWAMTTEGDGNYGLQRFLESEGAEVDIQTVTNWILFMLWEQRWDTQQRMTLRQEDKGKKGLQGVNVPKKLASLWVAEKVVRGMFQVFARTIGLHNYPLADMNLVADTAKEYYNNHLRGGEGHMEVGKLILNVTKKKATMTLSVKPFGCMPSSGVSDGVQSFVTEKFPGAIFLPIETSGDGAVNVYSRVQMMLFKARQAARAEFDAACQQVGVTPEELRLFLAKHPRFSSPFYWPEHKVNATASDVVLNVAPYVRDPLHGVKKLGKKLSSLFSRNQPAH